MRFIKPLLWIAGLSAVALLASLDLNGLSDWSANRVFIIPNEPAHISVDMPWKVVVNARRRHPFGNVRVFETARCRKRLPILSS